MLLTCNLAHLLSLILAALPTHLLPPASPWIEPLTGAELVCPIKAAHLIEIHIVMLVIKAAHHRAAPAASDRGCF